MAVTLAISGGVGGAKLAEGLVRVLSPEDLTIVVNTADDFDFLGLHISPDLDTVLYTLAGLNNPETGWGRRDETWSFRDALAELGGETWFRLGDRDLATHVERTRRLRGGESLSAITTAFCRALRIRHPVVPMTDDGVRTIIVSGVERMAFQDYFVRRRCGPRVDGVVFAGAEAARPSPPLAERLEMLDGGTVVLCPSNPFVSVAPVLAIPGIRRALETSRIRVVAVSPIVGGAALKGPAAKMMTERGLECSVTGLAKHYGDLVDGLVIDRRDRAEAEAIEARGPKVRVTDTVMRDADDRKALAETVVEFADSLEPRAPRRLS